MEKIVKDKFGYLIPLEFTRMSGQKYRLISTTRKGDGWNFDVVDTVKSVSTGKFKEMSRENLINFINT